MSDADRLLAAAKEADRTAVYLRGTMTPTMHAVAAPLVVTVNAEKRWCDEASPVPGAWVQVRSAASDLRLAFDGMPAGTARARPDDWADPAPRVLDDDLAGSFRCVCGDPTLDGVTHSVDVCRGGEAS